MTAVKDRKAFGPSGCSKIGRSRERQREDAQQGANGRHEMLLFRASPPVTLDRCLTAGLLARGSVTFICLPAPRAVAWRRGATRMNGNPLTVAGAATVLVPTWVVRTVFPINPLRFVGGEPSSSR